MSIILAMVLAAAPVASFTNEQQETIKASIGRQLSDPFSAQYEWQPIKSDTVYCGWVNAKNQFGAYTGFRPYLILYYIGLKTKKLTIVNTAMETNATATMCPEAGYRYSR